MKSDIIPQHEKTFESIRKTDEQGNEFWFARQLSHVLEYSEYRHFQPVIERAKNACKNSGQVTENHFEDILDMVAIGSKAKREIGDTKLSRYACYLIVQNGDPTKPVIALGQTYFAIQTRRQEIADQQNFSQLSEDERRLIPKALNFDSSKFRASAASAAAALVSEDTNGILRVNI